MSTYYVATTGNDANPGTIGSPWLTPSYACQHVAAGDTIYVRAGTYSDSLDSFTTGFASGTLGNPITISGYPSETVTIQPADNYFGLRFAAPHAVSYWVIQDLIFDAANNTNAGIDGFIYLNGGSSSNVFRRIEVKNHFVSGLMFSDANGAARANQILDSSFHDNGRDPSGGNTGYGFYIKTDGNLVDGCTCYNNHGYGGQLFNSVNRTAVHDNIVSNLRTYDNVVHGGGGIGGSTGGGIVVGCGATNRLYNILTYRNGVGGPLGSQGHGVVVLTDARDALVSFVDAYANTGYAVLLQDYANAPTIENVVSRSNTAGDIQDNGGTGTPVLSHNWLNADGDPLFVNPASGDFRLQAGSPLGAAGVAVVGITTDFAGLPRSSPPAIGAYEPAIPVSPVVVTWTVPAASPILTGPTNTSPATAIAVTSADLPYDSGNVAVAGAGAGTLYPSSCDANQYMATWWKFTPAANQTLISLLLNYPNSGTSDYVPELSLWTGTPPSLTQYKVDAFGSQDFCDIHANDRWWEIPLPGTIYIQVMNQTAATASGTPLLRVKMTSQPFTAAPAGSLAIPDDTLTFPLALLSAADGTFLQGPTFPPGELAGVLPTGEILTQDDTSDSVTANLYDHTITLVTTVTFAHALAQIVANESGGAFYGLLTNGSARTLQKVTSAGAQTTTWTLVADTSMVVVDRAEAFAYYATTTNTLRKYNLGTNADVGQIHAAFAGESIYRDGGTLADGSVWIAYRATSNGRSPKIRVFDTAGTLLQTYTNATVGTDTLNHATYYTGTGGSDPESVWVWNYASGSVFLDRFTRLKMSDGSVVVSFTTAGMNLSGEPAQDNAQLAVSNSCPFFVLRQSVSPSPPTPSSTLSLPVATTSGSGIVGKRLVLRRLRRFPLVFDEHKRSILDRIEFLVQSGVGLGGVPSTTVGADPHLMVRASKDGGKTWSHERTVPIGKVGEYGRRAFLRRMGQGRNWVIEVTISDPVFAALVNCYVDMSPGTS